MPEEIFDIFNDQMQRIGTASRKEAHAKGLWHQTFHCWIVNKEKNEECKLLFQLRHKDKDTFPDLLDISCAGHLQAGETVEDGIRELKEELGLNAAFCELTYCGTVAEEHVITDELIDREFNQIFIYGCHQPLNEYKPQVEEVSGLFWIHLLDLKRLLEGCADFAGSEGIVLNEANGAAVSVNKQWRRYDLVPHSKAYYDLLFDAVHRFIELKCI